MTRYSRRLRAALLSASALLSAVTMTATLTAPLTAHAASATKSPAVPAGLPAGIEPMGAGMYAATCDPVAKVGATKLAKLLTSTYPGTSAGIGRACTTDTRINSEHMEGRAIDWMDSVRIPKEKAQAQAVLKWLFATDSAGHTYANARRLGVMYVIWNNKIWGAYSADQGWREYNNCSSTPAKSLDSACHRNHIHISLTWAGATGATSFWSKKVAGPNYGPCRAKDLNVAPNYTKVNPTRCVTYRKVTAAAGSSAAKKVLIAHSGQTLKNGSRGAVVKTVQKIIGATIDGSYGPQTVARVKTWQQAKGISATGTVNEATWRVLLKTVR